MGLDGAEVEVFTWYSLTVASVKVQLLCVCVCVCMFCVRDVGLWASVCVCVCVGWRCVYLSVPDSGVCGSP